MNTENYTTGTKPKYYHLYFLQVMDRKQLNRLFIKFIKSVICITMLLLFKNCKMYCACKLTGTIHTLLIFNETNYHDYIASEEINYISYEVSLIHTKVLLV